MTKIIVTYMLTFLSLFYHETSQNQLMRFLVTSRYKDLKNGGLFFITNLIN